MRELQHGMQQLLVEGFLGRSIDHLPGIQECKQTDPKSSKDPWQTHLRIYGPPHLQLTGSQLVW